MVQFKDKDKRKWRNQMTRCDWAQKALEIDYHDQEWGKPKYDDAILFEMLILEGMQAGLRF